MAFIKFGLAILFFLYSLTLASCSSGQCDYPDDRARDGSRCGDRAASVRPGGRNPDLNNFFYGVLFVGGGFLVFKLNKQAIIECLNKHI